MPDQAATPSLAPGEAISPSPNEILFKQITEKFTGISQFTDPYGLLTIELEAGMLLNLVKYLKEEQGFIYLTDLCGMHFPGGHLEHPSKWSPGDTLGPQLVPGSGTATQRGSAPVTPEELRQSGHSASTGGQAATGSGSSYSEQSPAGTAYDQGYDRDAAKDAALRGTQPIPDTKGELGVVYHLHALVKNLRVRLKVFFPASHPEIPSLTSLFKGANWMERETYDFYGIIFTGHPDLRRILNVDEMIAFPMRKEFPLEDQHRKDKQDQFFGR